MILRHFSRFFLKRRKSEMLQRVNNANLLNSVPFELQNRAKQSPEGMNMNDVAVYFLVFDVILAN